MFKKLELCRNCKHPHNYHWKGGGCRAQKCLCGHDEV